MNKFAAAIAVATFALGAVAGHSMTAPAPAVVSFDAAPVSPFDLMRTAAMSPETGDQTVCQQHVMCD